MSTNKDIKDDLKPPTDIDRIIHEPARLLIMAHLYIVESADFLFLKRQTDLTWGNLSSHITKLESVGYINVKKEFVKKKPHTRLQLTNKGRAAFKKYQKEMKQFFEKLP